MIKQFLLLVLISLSIPTFAQNSFIGKWEMKYANEKNDSPIKLSLQIGIPEKRVLYPATLTIECDSFSASYELLLVKKNSRQLFISKNKLPITETPFSIGNWTYFFNGTLDFKINFKGDLLLTNNRFPVSFEGIKMNEVNNYPINYQPLANKISQFLFAGNIAFTKINNEILNTTQSKKITTPKLSSTYFGLIDTIFTKSEEASIKFQRNNDNDIVSVKLNEEIILDQVDSRKKRDKEDIILDTGLNIISFFSDDFGSIKPSNASIKIEFENYKKVLSFNDTENIGATFILAEVYLQAKSNGGINNYDEKRITVDDQENYSYLRYYRKIIDSSEKRSSRIIGDFITQLPQLTFAIWDDAVEDGDTISLSINNKWITQNFPVKKKPQFLTVFLQPGTNLITFSANNLGSIPPNTSVLEIIDGKKRKSFYIETDLNLNNQVRIYYDIK